MWPSGFIYRIDARTGTVVNRIDARALLDAQQAAEADVLNGIAFDSRTGHLLLTGKLWPSIFEVEVSPPLVDDQAHGGGCALSHASQKENGFHFCVLLCMLGLIGRQRKSADVTCQNQ
jgi:hypothetical protein